MRVVFDTNVYVSALIGKGQANALLQRALRAEFQVIISYQGLAELTMVMRTVFDWPDDEVYRWHKRIGSHFSVIRLVSQVSGCRDASDNQWLACALDGNADYFISRDKDLLTIKEFMGIPIISVKDFWKVLQRS
jgi:putative PIN family toxin of toxin-antitoxin system